MAAATPSVLACGVFTEVGMLGKVWMIGLFPPLSWFLPQRYPPRPLIFGRSVRGGIERGIPGPLPSSCSRRRGPKRAAQSSAADVTMDAKNARSALYSGVLQFKLLVT